MLKLIACSHPYPKSRLSCVFLTSSVFLEAVKAKTVLEVGIGAGAITKHVLDRQAGYLIGTEVESDFIELAKNTIGDYLSKNTELFLTDGELRMPPINGTEILREGKVDIAFWNPPQQPRPDGEYAGPNGDKWIKIFIDKFDALVCSGGKLFVSCTNMISIPEIIDYARDKNLYVTIVHEVSVPIGEFPELIGESDILVYINQLKKEKGEADLGAVLRVVLFEMSRVCNPS
jgi:tRNA1(Val) A37 N6-methylase TrmN6